MHQGIVRYRSLSSDQLLNDLYWCVSSPSLLVSKPPEFKGELLYKIISDDQQDKFQQWFKALSTESSLLIDFFANDDQLIVGKYFERLLYFFFSHYHQFDVHYSGKQLFDGDRTIGEIDFIIEDLHTNEIIHIEIAVKYYMGYRNTSKHSMWIGPNGMDTLEKKMKKFEKQLALSKSEELSKLIKVDKRKILLKGYFFKHFTSYSVPYFNKSENDECWWLYQNEMNKVIDAESYYSIIPKNKWLGFYFDSQLDFYKGKDIMHLVDDQIKSIGKGIMLAKLDSKRTSVIAKLIVAPMKWPKL